MGFPAFAKIFRYGILAAVALAAGLLAAIALASPASAQRGGDYGHPELVDTDNLKYRARVNGSWYGYSAKSFGIPYLDDSNRGSESACGRGGVADAFFQRSAIRNDMPVVDTSKSEFALTTPSAVRACSIFVEEQNRAQMEAGRNGGYYLDVEGRLGRGAPSHFATTRSAGNDRVVSSYSSSNGNSNGFWANGGKIHYTTQAYNPQTNTSYYIDRVDLKVGSNVRYAVVPGGTKFVIPAPPVAKSASSGGSVNWVPDFSQVSGVTIRNAKALGWGYFQGGNHIGAYCPVLLHPRGEDAVRRIGTGTGRTLSSLKTEANVQKANEFWCRSDKRYVISYKTEIEPGTTCSTDGAPPCPSKFRLPANGEEARYYGRVNCYRTVLELKTTATSQTDRNSCGYIFPLPQCTKNGAKHLLNSVQIAKHQIGAVFPFASDGTTACDTNPQCTDGSSKRDMTDAELQAYRTARGASFTPASDGSTPCTAAVAASAAADFTADACVTAILEIYENRPKGFDAEPGVRADHRTVAADTANPAFDLDVAAAHPGTASPPRAAGDPSGCADGSEARADHGTADSAARKNTAAADAVTTAAVGLPKSSAAVNSQHPPHSKGFASSGTDYTGAVKNIAHRFASDVAENTCAAKLTEAEMVLSEMKARRLEFQRYIDNYESDLDAAIGVFGSYSADIRTGPSSGANSLGLKIRQHNAEETRREDYVDLRKDHLDNLKLALTDAESAYQTASSQSVTALTSDSGCVAAYDTKIAALRKVQKDAEIDFPTTVSSRNGVSTVKNHLRNFNQQGGPNLNVGRITISGMPTSPLRRPTSPSWTAGATSSTTTYHCNTGGETGFSLTSDNKCTKTVSTTSYVYSSPTETEEDGETVYSCPRGASLITGAYQIKICRRSVTSSRTVTGTVRTTITHSWTEKYSRTRSGTITGSYTDPTTQTLTTPATTYRKSVGYARTFKGSRSCSYVTGYNSSPTTCGIPTHNTPTGRTPAQAKAMVEGSKPNPTANPGFTPPTKPADHTSISNLSLLGKYHPQHPDRANLKAATAADRDTAAANLGSLSAGNIATAATGATSTPQNIANSNVPTSWGATGTTAATRRSDLQTETNDYKTAYTRAYNTAYNQAAADMGTTATTTTWNNFAWSYETSSLVWGGYLADEGQPVRSRGCYLIDAAGDGKVTVQTARMDFETGSYAVGETYSRLFSGERNCKVRRTRTPQLNLKYQPANPDGTDLSLAPGYFHTDYQPNTADERFKLAAETEIFTIRAKVADSPPVFCGTTLPADGYLSHTAGQMASVPALIAKDSWRSAAQLTTTILRPTSNPPAVTKDHCFARPRLTATDKPRLVVFDDTAHSDMNLVYLQKDPDDTTGINLFTGGAFTKYALETYRYPGDNNQQSVFYGAIWEPPDALGSSTGWDILDDNNPATDLNTKIKNRIVARDKTATPNLAAVPADTNFEFASAMGFNIGFLDCRPDIENVVFIGNITAARQNSNQANDYAGITSASGYPMDAPQWYYPPWNEIKGQTRADGSTVAVGPNSRIYTHPQSARYGWVIEAVNNIATDKQPVVGFLNRPDVKHGDTNRPSSLSLDEHRRVCLGDRDAIPHYRSANAALPPSDEMRDTLGYPTDSNPQQAMVVWSEHNLLCKPENNCREWTTRCYRDREQTDCPPAGQPLPAGVIRYDDKSLVDANIRRVILDSDLADTEEASADAVRLLSDRQRWPWLAAGEKFSLATASGGTAYDQP